jgi:hypothetical protein
VSLAFWESVEKIADEYRKLPAYLRRMSGCDFRPRDADGHLIPCGEVGNQLNQGCAGCPKCPERP